MYIYTTIAALVAGYVLDLCIGDPHGMWHPICFVGNLISFFEKRLRRGRSERADLAGGVLLVILVTGISTAIPFGILFLCYHLWFWLGFAVEVYMCYTVLATKSLKTESMKVAEALEQEGLEAGRYAVSMIVGRDTKELTETGVVKAAVETVAENTSDGILAPMFYMVIGGPVLGYFYKAVNTMDSMVGYKNDKFLYFGRAAAKFDDVMNFLPSRISGILMVLAAPLVKLDGKMPGKFLNVTGCVMPVRIQPRRNLSWQGHCRSSWRAMPGILEKNMRNQPSGIQSVRWRLRILPGQTGYCMRRVRLA